nr:ribonuclease H-like domain-containing protein [Tanacetum cinerariifolium]
MALPDKHQLKFNSHKDAKTLMEAIEKRFGGNTETKKVQKTLLKQQFKNFSGSSSEGLDQIHDRLQKLISQLEIHGVSLSQKDVNLKKFLQKTGKNLGANGPTSMGFDMAKVECYNYHRKGHFARECRSPKDSRRTAVAEPQRRNVPVETSTSNALVSQPSAPIIEDWISDSEEDDMPQVTKDVTSFAQDIHKQYALMNHSKFPLHKIFAAAPPKSQPLLTTAARPVSVVKPKFSKTRPNLVSHAVSKFKSPLRRHFPRHPSSKPSNSPPRVTAAKPSTALKDKRVIDIECSRHMIGNMSYLSDFKELNGGYVAFGGNPKGGKITGKGKIKTGKLDFDDVYFVKELKFNLFSAMFDCENYYSSESDSDSWPPSNLYDGFVPSSGYHAVPPPVAGTFMPPKPDLVFHTPSSDENEHLAFNVQLSPTKPEQDLSSRPSAPIIEDWISDSEKDDMPQVTKDVPSFTQSPKLVKSPRHSGLLSQPPMAVAPPVPLRTNSPSKGYRKPRKLVLSTKYAPMNHPKFPLHKVSAAAPPKSQPILTTAARPVSAVKIKFSKTRPNLASHAVSKSKLLLIRHFPQHPSSKPSTSPPRVTAAKSSAVSAAQNNQGTWGNPQQALKDKGVIDSGFSRHMTGNMSYLSNFEELNRGYVAFGGNPKGGKITRKGKINTRKLDFDDVYFVKELKFNLFSVSQMCDKKNSVLFTDTECLVLSSDFKLPDASQVLLRVPRENKMYNVNLKNIIPSGDLTCLFAKQHLMNLTYGIEG